MPPLSSSARVHDGHTVADLLSPMPPSARAHRDDRMASDHLGHYIE
jgi:hypothetical protein